MGWSSPIVAGGLVFVSSVIASADPEPPKKGLYFGGNRTAPRDEHRGMVYAFDLAMGKPAWENEVYRGVPAIARHLKNSYASETAAAGNGRVHFLFGGAGVFSYKYDGTNRWKHPLPAQETRYGWGTASSPVLHEGRLYVQGDNDAESYLLALDASTGKRIWRVARDEKSNWSTPFVWKNGKRTEIVVCGTKRVRSYDLDGKVLWELGGMSSIVIPTPFTRHGLLYVTSGYVGDQVRPVFAIKPGAAGDISLKAGETSNQFIAWFHPQAGPYNTTPVVYDGIYYTLFDRGMLTAHDARTGKEIYGKVRLDPESAAFTASPWAYNGKIFALSEDGDTFVVQAGPEYKLLRKNRLDEMCMATPAIVDGTLIVRTAGHLYRIGKGK